MPHPTFRFAALAAAVLSASCSIEAIVAVERAPRDAGADVPFIVCTTPNCGCPGGTIPFEGICVVDESSCDAPSDIDTRTIAIASVGLAETGFNVDNINNASAPAGMGSTIAGCGKVDVSGGIDNSLQSVSAALSSVVDVDAALLAMIAPVIRMDGGVPDGGAFDAGQSGDAGIDPDGGAPNGSAFGHDTRLELALSRLAANNPPNDSCVHAELRLERGGQTSVTSADGVLVNHVVNLIFRDPLQVPVPLVPPAASCVAQSCSPTPLVLELRGVRALIRLDATHSRVLAGSLLGGFLFFGDCTNGTIDAATGTCVGGGFVTPNAHGVQTAVRVWSAETHVATTFEQMFLSAVSGSRDLHMGEDGTLSACTGPNSSTTNRNAISFAFELESL